MKKTKKLFLDVVAVNNYGKKAFLDSSEWPVTEKMFFVMVNFIFTKYISLLENQNISNYSVGIIELNFVNRLIQIFHYNFIKNYAKENNVELVFSEASKSLLYPNWNGLKNHYHNYSYPYNKLQRAIRRVLKAIIFNRNLGIFKIFKGVLFSTNNSSLGSYDDIKKEYILPKNKFYQHYEWIDIIYEAKKKLNSFSASDISDIKKTTNFFNTDVVDKMLLAIKSNPIFKKFIYGMDLTLIANVWKKRVEGIFQIQIGLNKLKMPEELLITEAGNPFHKIIAAVYKKNNVKVINFSHGNDIALINQKWTNFQLFSICNFYAFETKAIRCSFEKYKNKLPLEFKENIKYLNVKENKNKKLEVLAKANKKKTNNIMLMGYPYNTIRYTDDVFCFFNFRLKLEIEVLKVLKQTSYNIIYKAHPDRFLELGSLMNEKKVNVVSERFESVWNEADVLIFTYATTTTFGFALNCPIPIVLINMDTTPWIRERKKILEKRVAFISKSSKKNSKEINIEELSKAISLAKERVNIEAIKCLTG